MKSELSTTCHPPPINLPPVICPQHLDQFFWAERVRHLRVGSVLDRSLFSGQESLQGLPPREGVSRACSAILSASLVQVSLACPEGSASTRSSSSSSCVLSPCSRSRRCWLAEIAARPMPPSIIAAALAGIAVSASALADPFSSPPPVALHEAGVEDRMAGLPSRAGPRRSRRFLLVGAWASVAPPPGQSS